MAKFCTDGVNWSQPINLSNHNGLDRFAEGVFDDNGNFHVVWLSKNDRKNKEEDLFRSRINGNWTNTKAISNGVLAKGALKTYNGWLTLNYSADIDGFYDVVYTSMIAPIWMY